MIGMIAKAVIGGLLEKALAAFTAYQNRQISKDEFDAEIQKAKVAGIAEIEDAWAKASAEMFESFQKTLRGSRALRIAYIISLVASIWVLFWYAWLQPCWVAWKAGSFPACKTGDLILSWHYMLLAGQLGLGPLIFRGGATTGTRIIEKITGRR